MATVQSWLNSRLAAGDSIAKVHVMRTVLAAALTRAMREELVPRNVARLATLPAERPARQQPWSASEARAFLHAARGNPLYPAFVTRFAAYNRHLAQRIGRPAPGHDGDSRPCPHLGHDGDIHRRR